MYAAQARIRPSKNPPARFPRSSQTGLPFGSPVFFLLIGQAEYGKKIIEPCFIHIRQPGETDVPRRTLQGNGFVRWVEGLSESIPWRVIPGRFGLLILPVNRYFAHTSSIIPTSYRKEMEGRDLTVGEKYRCSFSPRQNDSQRTKVDKNAQQSIFRNSTPSSFGSQRNITCQTRFNP
jgi:hypothetical protein